MTEIIFIRHAQAEGNYSRRLHGYHNSLLTKKGHIQADAAGKYLSDVKISKIYASDLTRTYMTALHVAAYQGCDVEKDPGLRECFAGDWEDKPFSELESLHNEQYSAWRDDTFSFTFPNGESLLEMTERVGKTVDRIAENHDGERIAVVSHATPIRSLKLYYKELTVSEMRDFDWPSNASVSRGFYQNGVFRFNTYDENGFLDNI